MKKQRGKIVLIVVVAVALVAALVVLFTMVNKKQVDPSAKHVVALDAGHGGDDLGNIGLVNEAGFSQGVVNELKTLLSKDERFEVILTHEEGQPSSTTMKAQRINESSAEILLSIHADYSDNPEDSGLKVYSVPPNRKNYDKSNELANYIASNFLNNGAIVRGENSVFYYYYKEIKPEIYQINIVDQSDMNERTDKTQRLMEEVNIPVVMVDQIYVSNQAEVDTWATEKGYKQAAKLYYQSLKQYFGFE